MGFFFSFCLSTQSCNLQEEVTRQKQYQMCHRAHMILFAHLVAAVERTIDCYKRDTLYSTFTVIWPRAWKWNREMSERSLHGGFGWHVAK